MKQRSEMDSRVERALESLDGIQRAAPAPWLFTRIKARLAGEDRTTWGVMSTFLSRPSVTIAGLCIILVLNATLLLNKAKTVDAPGLAGHNEHVMDSESLIASSSSFDYENLVQP